MLQKRPFYIRGGRCFCVFNVDFGQLFAHWKITRSLLSYRCPKEFFGSGFFNPFHATGLFLKPLKTLENHRFCDVFRGYGKKPEA